MIVCKIKAQRVTNNNKVYIAAILTDMSNVPIVKTIDLPWKEELKYYAIFDADWNCVYFGKKEAKNNVNPSPTIVIPYLYKIK